MFLQSRGTELKCIYIIYTHVIVYKHVCFHTYIATCGAKAAKEIRMYGIQYYKGKKKMFVLNGLTDKKVTPYITNILAKTKIERK